MKITKLLSSIILLTLIPSCSHNHVFNEAYQYNDLGHWKHCDKCSYDDQLSEHDFETKIVDSTCTDTGLLTKTCNLCGYQTYETIEKTPHIFGQENTDDKYLKSAATYKNPAEYYYSCKCGKVGTTSFVYGERLSCMENVFASRYIEVEYIESTGTQWIDTGISMPSGFKAECNVLYTDNNGGYIVGSHNINSPYGRNGCYYVGSRNTWEIGYGETCPNFANNIDVVNNRVNVEFSTICGNAYLKVNDKMIGQSNESQVMSDLNILIFYNQYHQYHNVKTTKARLYDLKIYDSSQSLIRDFTPVIDSTNGEAGLYDQITNTFLKSEKDPFLRGDFVNHNFIETNTVEPTYKDFGYIEYECDNCRQTYKEILDRTSYKVDFVVSDGVEINIYDSQDYSKKGTPSLVAYSFDVDKKEYTKEDGQVNFNVVYDSDNFVLNQITIDGDYKNLKNPSDNNYRITKIKSDLTVYIELGLEIACSKDSGFYDNDIEVSFSSKKGTIYYTLDGSIPDQNSYVYTSPLSIGDASLNQNTNSMNTNTSGGFLEDLINALGNNSNTYPYIVPGYKAPDTLIDKCTVIKAIAIDGDKKYNVITRSFFVNYDEKDGYENTGIISLSVNQDDFFGYENGIYVLGKTFDNTNIFNYWWTPYYWWWSGNFTASGIESERECYIEVFDENKTNVLNKDVGVRIHGNGSRGYIEKSLNFYARDEYDNQNYFDFSFFGNDYEPHKLSLLTGGDDYQYKLYDYIMSEYGQNQNYSMAKMTRYCLFINGEFWGYYYLSEKLDDNYFEYYYSVDKDNLVVVKDGQVDEGQSSDINYYYNYYNYISTADLTNSENYEYLNSILDIDSFIDYYAMLGYADRAGDWPTGNTALWRTRSKGTGEYEDGKWRYIMFDINSSAFNNATNNPIEYLNNFAPFRHLYRNADFKKRFDAKLVEIANTVFELSDVESFIDNFSAETRVQMIKEYERFYGSTNNKIEAFDQYIDDIKNFFVDRKTYILENFSTSEHIHSYTSSITKDPTFLEEGEKTFVCGCGDTYTESIPPLDKCDYSYKVTFVCDDGIKIGVYNGQDYKSGYEEIFTAYSTSKSGDLLKDGEGQVNFKVINNTGKAYSISISGSYKNLKGKEDTSLDDVYRVTKIKSDLVITITLNDE